MKINNTDNASPVQAFIDNIQAKQDAAQNKVAKEPKTLHISDEISFMLPETKSKEEIKVEQLLLKLSSGKELSPAELQYISANAPEKMELVNKTIAERKQLEAMMEAAKSKAEASMAAATVMQVAVNSTDVPQEAAGKINMIRGVFNEYAKSTDFKNKPDSLADEYNPKLDEAIRKASKLINENIETDEKTDTNIDENRTESIEVAPETQTAPEAIKADVAEKPLTEEKSFAEESVSAYKEHNRKIQKYKDSQKTDDSELYFKI